MLTSPTENSGLGNTPTEGNQGNDRDNGRADNGEPDGPGGSDGTDGDDDDNTSAERKRHTEFKIRPMVYLDFEVSRKIINRSEMAFDRSGALLRTYPRAPVF